MASLYDQMTGTPNYDDILNSNLSREQKAQAIQERGAAYSREVDKNKWKNIGRASLGSLVSAASFHPIMNVPYVGTGIGGALYDLGQGIAEGDKLPELAKRAGRGFVIGETVGAVPYVGKAASKTKVGQAVGNSAPVKAVGEGISKAGEKFAHSKLYDALMTDIKAFNPNKQTVYHGSPADFNKFSNEAIGTGEGAQAHGLGHYAALDKDVADTRYRNRLVDNNLYENVELNGQEIEKMPFGGYQYKNSGEKAAQGNGLVIDMALNRLAKNGNNVDSAIEYVSKELDTSNPWKYDVIDFLKNNNIKVTPNEGQLYKLSVPKDDVMLREDLPLNQQPQEVKNAIDKYFRENYQGNPNDYNFEKSLGIYNDLLGVNNGGKFYKSVAQQELSKFNKNPEKYKFKPSKIDLNNSTEQYELASKKLNDLGIKGISYNGGIDGEARVIFNPDDIDIVRKYYNQPGLYEQIIGKQNTGALVDALFNR
jgi:hypothetical protein